MTQDFQVNPQSKNDVIDGRCGSMVAAAFMSRDGGESGGNIFIFEAAPLRGGILDGAGDAQQGYL